MPDAENPAAAAFDVDEKMKKKPAPEKTKDEVVKDEKKKEEEKAQS
jgi:hypothetical protein